MAEKRKSLSKKIRFEVFKRDNFTCRYCGKSAPDVVLEVDHIIPVSKGGTDDICNLATSCLDCNRGKGAKKLSDNSTVKKQFAQTKELAQRREQIELFAKWQNELLQNDNLMLEKINLFLHKKYGCSLSNHGCQYFIKATKRYGFDIAFKAYDNAFNYSINIAKGKDVTDCLINSCLKFESNAKQKPYYEKLLYIRGILRNRLHRLRDWDYSDKETIEYLENAYKAGMSINKLTNIVKDVESFDDFRNIINDFIENSGDKSAD